MSDAWDMATDAWDATGGKVVDGMFGTDPNKAWDKSNFDATNWASNPDYNKNAFSLGGQGADNAEMLAAQQGDVSGQYRDRGNAAQGRVMKENGLYSANDLQSRGEQQNATGLARAAAEGNAPSAAQGTLQNGFNQASAMQTAQAGGARGGAAIALAQGNAQANTAMMGQKTANDASILRANEMAQARGLYGSLSAQQRGQDQNRLAQSNQMAQFNRQSNDAYDIQNQQLAMQRQQEATRIRQLQMGGAMGQQQLLAESDSQAQGRDMQVNLYNTNAVKDRMKGVGGIMGGIGGSLMGMATGGMGGSLGQMASGSGMSGSGMGGGGGGSVSRYDPGY